MCAAPRSYTTRYFRPLGTPELPPELIQLALAEMPQRDLRALAQASRACYAHALEAGLRIHRHVYWTSDRGEGFGRSLRILDAVLDHAADRPDLNIAITVHVSSDGGDPADREAMQALLPSILRALPNLVQLVVPFADCTALCSGPAPKLRELTVHHARTEGPAFLPSNLFAGKAPKLRTVALTLIHAKPMAEWHPIAAFNGVTHLSLNLSTHSITGRLTLALIFPGRRVLRLSAPCPLGVGTQAVNLSGLSLRYFAFSGDAALLTAASASSLKDVDVVEHRPRGILERPIWPAPSGELCAVAERHGTAPTVSIGPRDGASWRRTVVTAEHRDGALPLAGMPVLASNLVTLTIESSLATAFVQTPIVLSALRELFVDLPKRGIRRGCPLERLDDAVPCVRCPALERVVLFADALTYTLGVAPHTVVRLGYTLGMRKARPTLILAGAAWSCLLSLECNITQLNQLFSDVDDAETTAIALPEYYNTCRYSDPAL